MKFTIPLLALLLVLAACQPTTPPDETLPTLAVLEAASATASITPTNADIMSEVTAEATTEAPAEATQESGTPAALPSETPTPTATLTRTPRPVTPTPTVEPTLAAISTATQAILEAPRYSTFTPEPSGGDQGVASYVADVTISEAQFQEEIDRNILAYPSMQSAVVDFVPGAINVQMTTVDDNFATMSGTVIITVTLSGELATITISDIRTEQVNTPQSYIDVAITDTFKMMVDTLDQIVTQRVGPQQKLKAIDITDTDILVTLVVPKTG
ncbi:MAG: hypothetical protein LCI00_25230 [Chloroflexi bacterium]|nr:hypothetical protein [Chloroflexota bacterium]MCC6895710.1 hypothetical protein [Anaerolineae bacterium]